jgi:PPOX class probable F420-dependent enzyme
MLDDAQREFLVARKWAVLATGRQDGSPQISTVAYLVDDEDRIVISVKAFTAKWKNALRQPRVALAINDDHAQLIVYGNAETIADDPERAALTGLMFAKLSGNEPPAGEDFIQMLDTQERTVLRVTPERVLMNE